jgi:hypothetical protein
VVLVLAIGDSVWVLVVAKSAVEVVEGVFRSGMDVVSGSGAAMVVDDVAVE